MIFNFRNMLLAMAVLAFMTSACKSESQDQPNSAGAPGTESSSDSQMDSKSLTPTSTSNAGEATPNVDKREAILDKVNQGPNPGDVSGVVTAGPPPGTESGQGNQLAATTTPGSSGSPSGQGAGVGQSGQAQHGPASPQEPVSTQEPENVPSQAEREAILNRVNQGPVPGGGSGQAGQGPAPGTESHEGTK